MLMCMASAVRISRSDVVSEIRELAVLRGVPLTVAVGDAIRSELGRMREIESRRRDVRRLVDEFHKLPRLGPPLTDDDLYDEDGLPK